MRQRITAIAAMVLSANGWAAAASPNTKPIEAAAHGAYVAAINSNDIETLMADLTVGGGWAFERYTYKSKDVDKKTGAVTTDQGKGINAFRRGTDGKWRVGHRRMEFRYSDREMTVYLAGAAWAGATCLILVAAFGTGVLTAGAGLSASAGGRRLFGRSPRALVGSGLRIYVVDGVVVGERIADPSAAGVAVSHVTVSVIDSAIKAHRRTPMPRMKDKDRAGRAPIRGGPKKS